MKNYYKNLIKAARKFIDVLLFLLFLVSANHGQAADLPTGLNNAFNTGANAPLNYAVKGAGYSTTATFDVIVSTVITLVLGLMGVIFLILAIYGGYTWMTARGNEDKVADAKKTLTNAILGIIIVLAAYAMVRLIVDVVGGKVFKP